MTHNQIGSLDEEFEIGFLLGDRKFWLKQDPFKEVGGIEDGSTGAENQIFFFLCWLRLLNKINEGRTAQARMDRGMVIPISNSNTDKPGL